MTKLNDIRIAPSILSADFADLGRNVQEVVKSGADRIHIDVMDGRFVPNLTVGPLVVEALRRVTDIDLDVHLMIEEPEQFLSAFHSAGANHLTVHQETCKHLHRTIYKIKELGLNVGVGINPATPISAIEEILPLVDVLLVATVDPGFAGQKLIPETLEKVKRLKDIIKNFGYQTEIQVDGGVNHQNISLVIDKGADILVAGTAVFSDYSKISDNMKRLLEAARR